MPEAAVARRRPLLVTVASGKGGVGKTTVAVNLALALSRFGRTILIDTDTATSSIRNILPGEPQRDLYHFFRRNARLEDCLTSLSASADPEGRFRDFGYVAAPAHFIDDIVNWTAARREALMRSVNRLVARFIVLDLRAGADDSVLDFLPAANSGILVFTPHHPAATNAAADLVKASIFRKLRSLFGEHSAVWKHVGGTTMRPVVEELISRVEDPYDPSIPNLDAFVADLEHAFGSHAVVELLRRVLDTYKVYFVLNRFDAVDEAYASAVRPFTESLASQISTRLRIINLGWVADHKDVHESNRRRRPLMLDAEPEPSAPRPKTRAELGLEETERSLAGSRPTAGRSATSHPDARRAPDPGPQLGAQLEALKTLYRTEKRRDPRDNFRYIASRVLYYAENALPGQLGDERLFTPTEALASLSRF
jgi:MinD-like ATPase involved in chromosome partitioning or flagellar assembly